MCQLVIKMSALFFLLLISNIYDTYMIIPTFYVLYLPLPGYTGSFEVGKVTFKLDQFLKSKVKNGYLCSIFKSPFSSPHLSAVIISHIISQVNPDPSGSGRIKQES